MKYKRSAELLKSTFVKTAGNFVTTRRSPDEELGQLFIDVQKSGLFSDNKTFADLVPRRRVRMIRQEYELEKQDPRFDLREFVNRHFYEFNPQAAGFHTDPSTSVRQHITDLWTVLERSNRRNRGSLLALPHRYIVPGGRFKEQFYWDSYFIMLGLAADGRWSMIEGMLKNYCYLLRKYGYIPTGNRTYFLSRSQPPFFSYMVELLAKHKGKQTLVEYLPYLLIEHAFWMKGHSQLKKQPLGSAVERVVKMSDGVDMNRYYDNQAAPRPESLQVDLSTAEYIQRRPEGLYVHLRAAAESGWDFSSRWFLDPTDIHTIHTVDFLPVDLNCLLYHLEGVIIEAYSVVKQARLAEPYRKQAESRATMIRRLCWDKTRQFYTDYNFHTQQISSVLSLAGVFPLYEEIATAEQAKSVAYTLKKDFLKEGGLITTLVQNGQQWDSPNGWAPLQYIAIQGLRRYGFNELATEIKNRWVCLNERVFSQKGKLIEKYNVVTDDALGGGGEYPLQDGFGWTNGVLATLLDESVV